MDPPLPLEPLPLAVTEPNCICPEVPADKLTWPPLALEVAELISAVLPAEMDPPFAVRKIEAPLVPGTVIEGELIVTSDPAKTSISCPSWLRIPAEEVRVTAPPVELEPEFEIFSVEFLKLIPPLATTVMFPFRAGGKEELEDPLAPRLLLVDEKATVPDPASMSMLPPLRGLLDPPKEFA
jgi:hypothetical protein